jgi:N-acetylmuramoyl-L-alanine amidase
VERYPIILIDAGHGGEDGGAVGVDGTIEKNINLAIARKLERFLSALGFRVAMTRNEDKAIYDPGNKGLREKKTSDIHNRFAMMEALAPNCLFVSIHQNHFVSEQYHGAQMFYSRNHPQSLVLAQAFQKRVVELLQPENTRKVKPCGAEVYLIYHAKVPAVLVECGFLSNYAEAQRLKTDEYQNQIAYALACGLLDYAAQ